MRPFRRCVRHSAHRPTGTNTVITATAPSEVARSQSGTGTPFVSKIFRVSPPELGGIAATVSRNAFVKTGWR